MKFYIQHNTKSNTIEAYYRAKKNKIVVYEKGRKVGFLFEAIRDTVKSLGKKNNNTVVWKRKHA